MLIIVLQDGAFLTSGRFHDYGAILVLVTLESTRNLVKQAFIISPKGLA